MMNTEAQYRAEWAAKTGRPASEIYVPGSLRVAPIAVGDTIRILTEGLDASTVEAGDILTVQRVDHLRVWTDAPGLTYSPDARWTFALSSEGTGWERVQ